jgi:hypothetical protein
MMMNKESSLFPIVQNVLWNDLTQKVRVQHPASASPVHISHRQSPVSSPLLSQLQVLSSLSCHHRAQQLAQAHIGLGVQPPQTDKVTLQAVLVSTSSSLESKSQLTLTDPIFGDDGVFSH